MINIKKWLYPSRQNNHHPIILRPLGLALLLVMTLAINSAYNYSLAGKGQVLGYATSISPSEIIALSNQQRSSRGIAALAYNGQLTQAAQAKAQDMFAKQYWSHYSPDGTGAAYFIAASGYSYSIAGENLAKDFNTSSGVVNGWMNSPTHAANVLNTSFVDTGVAAINGVLNGAETTIVVAMYAKPAAVAPAPAPAATTPTASTTTQPAPVAKAVPAPAPTSTPEPEPTSQVAPQSTESSTPTSGATAPAPSTPAAQISAPSPPPMVPTSDKTLSVREDLNWAQRSTLFLLSVVLLINVLKHTLIWRTQKRGWRHIWFRAHPAAQFALLAVAMVMTLTGGVGVIK